MAAVALNLLASVLQAATEAVRKGGSSTPGGPEAFADHPLLTIVIHVLFLAVIIGMGAAMVAALFKPPFDK